MAFVICGLGLQRDAALLDWELVELEAGYCFYAAPGRSISEQGLDHATWAAERASEVPGRVAYVEADFAGGVGSQAAMGWEDGELQFGPVRTQDAIEGRARFEVIEPLSEWAINRALRWLGVTVREGKDEFDTLDLVRLR